MVVLPVLTEGERSCSRNLHRRCAQQAKDLIDPQIVGPSELDDVEASPPGTCFSIARERLMQSVRSLRHDLSQSQEYQPRTANGNRVFDERRRRILFERGGQARAEGVSAESADDRAAQAGDEPSDRGVMRKRDRRTADRAAQ
jgi:hypothetical protein